MGAVRILVSLASVVSTSSDVEGAFRLGDAPIKVQQNRKKLMEGHFNISITKRVSLENSTDLGRGAAPELKSVEFLSETLLVVEQTDLHTNFTARQMLYLYRSITR